MTIYQRASGGHVAESLRPLEDSPEAVELARLANDPESGWRAVAEEPPVPVEPESPDISPAPVEPVEPVAPAERPAKGAAKAEWVAYAVAQGAEQADAETATKDDLIKAHGGEPDGAGE
ncbi:hypothetical protein ABZ567_31210 [Streptomyces sp. NPDC016459]|uniref:hypothetical protein n=1 Tax=Streptomyces sp. NPDC016459 TaxID=3157190 RepID=UPI0033E487E4